MPNWDKRCISVLPSSQFLPPTALEYLMFPTIPRGTPPPAYNYPFVSLLMCQKTMNWRGGSVKWSDILIMIKLNWAWLLQLLLVSFLGTSHFKKKWHMTSFSKNTVSHGLHRALIDAPLIPATFRSFLQIPVPFQSNLPAKISKYWYCDTYTGTVPRMDQNGMVLECMTGMDTKNCQIW